MIFEADTKARADMKPGTLYAISGSLGHIYHGQVTTDKSIGFFHRRDSHLPRPEDILSSSIMSVVTVAYPSITRALRSGIWQKLGRFPLADQLMKLPSRVHWPVGALMVTVCGDDGSEHETSVDDPSIQNLELMMVWDAEHHIPNRLEADFEDKPERWKTGGTVLQKRLQMQESAQQFPDKSWLALPENWVVAKAN